MVPSPPTTTAMSQASAKRLAARRGKRSMPVLAAVSSSRETVRPWATRKAPTDSSSSRMPALNFPTSASVPEGWRHSRDYTTEPVFDRGENAVLPLVKGDPAAMLDERAKTLLKALVETLHRRWPAGGLAHALAGQRPRALAGHHQERDGRSRRARPHRQPAHQRRPHSHGARLPALRRHHADGAAGLAAGTGLSLGRAADRSAAPCRPAAAGDRQCGPSCCRACRASSA